MVFVCCVHFCLSNSKPCSGVQLHRFPRNSAICTKWVAAVANTREDGIFNLMKYYHRICTRHFDEQYRIKKPNGEILRLRRGAIPTIFDNDSLVNQNCATDKAEPISIAKPSSLVHCDGIRKSDCKLYQRDKKNPKLNNSSILMAPFNEWSYRKRRRFYNQACQFSEQDLEIPHKRKLFWNVFHVMRQENLMHVKSLENQKQRSKIKINTLNNLIHCLRNNDHNDNDAEKSKIIEIKN